MAIKGSKWKRYVSRAFYYCFKQISFRDNKTVSRTKYPQHILHVTARKFAFTLTNTFPPSTLLQIIRHCDPKCR